MTKLFLTRIVFEVLSEEAPIEFDNLLNIHDAVTDGDCVGHFVEDTVNSISGKKAADWLYNAGSEPGFFRLDDDGNPLP